MMWNEFEVVDVQRFRQPDIAQFAAAADATDRIYTHRCCLACHLPLRKPLLSLNPSALGPCPDKLVGHPSCLL